MKYSIQDLITYLSILAKADKYTRFIPAEDLEKIVTILEQLVWRHTAENRKPD